MIKSYGDAPKPGKRYTRRPGVYAILLRNHEVLATYQAKPTPEIQLPGGGIDKGEHPIAALHREVMEETGWRMAMQYRFGAFRRFTYMPEYDLWAEKLCTIYVARPTLQVSKPTEPGHEALWLPLGSASQVLGNPGDRAMMARFAGQFA
ncbi:8-oxo-dGTP diphosphatase [Pseudorhodobacter antarcticus]|jgi:8-oxo-dGTP diphosphatase|uniref:8-oxo-dGTP diphosphatase n=1 Tax=Pseudorhodobacter antarcticus TaxID=1077947 RepID=A0A1H8C2F9_9RHOB|nr:NUDIX hydrolase [Pseudorhodobacter antarcticus]SEM89275.1 8-oxo-dGTP diphosphatase [Pseudorhodobacter antarcticus]